MAESGAAGDWDPDEDEEPWCLAGESQEPELLSNVEASALELCSSVFHGATHTGDGMPGREDTSVVVRELGEADAMRATLVGVDGSGLCSSVFHGVTHTGDCMPGREDTSVVVRELGEADAMRAALVGVDGSGGRDLDETDAVHADGKELHEVDRMPAVCGTAQRRVSGTSGVWSDEDLKRMGYEFLDEAEEIAGFEEEEMEDGDAMFVEEEAEDYGVPEDGGYHVPDTHVSMPVEEDIGVGQYAPDSFDDSMPVEEDIGVGQYAPDSFDDSMPDYVRLDDFSEDTMSKDLMDLDYAPAFVEDPNFSGIAPDCALVCRNHKMAPQQCVAFEGSNTGRRFYLCHVENHVLNCGFVAWKDEEWPEHLSNAIVILWAMYHESNDTRIDEKVENAKVLALLAEEKAKIEKKHATLLADVKKYMESTKKKAMVDNLANMNAEKNAEKKAEKEVMEESESEMNLLKKEVENLKTEACMLKQIQITQADVLRVRQKEWEEEKQAMKAEKEATKEQKDVLKAENKKLDYLLFDLFKANTDNKEKMKKIAAICAE